MRLNPKAEVDGVIVVIICQIFVQFSCSFSSSRHWMIWSFLQVTKEKFKTKATETFARVVQGAKKGVVKAHCEMLRRTTGLSVVAMESSCRKLSLFTFFVLRNQNWLICLGLWKSLLPDLLLNWIHCGPLKMLAGDEGSSA